MPVAPRTPPATLAALSFLAACGVSSAQTLSDSVRGSTTPTQAPGNQNVQNGDFVILANDLAPTTGDGIDEHTVWSFNLGDSPDYPAFLNGPLVAIHAARLRLTLTQFYPEGPVTDIVGPYNLGARIVLPHFLTAGETGGITLDLLSVFTWQELAHEIRAHNGRLAMVYADDAIVSFARIDLELMPCPADFNGDGFADFFDVDAFVNCFEGGACPPGKTADFNGDGFVDFFDIDGFITEFERGC